MIRALPTVVTSVVLALMVGCSGDDRDGLITNVTNQISDVATSVSTLKTKLEAYEKKMEGADKDEEAAKKELADAVAEAEKLKDTAKKLQRLSAEVANAAPTTPEEKKAYLDRHFKRINQTRDDLIANHREFKAKFAEVEKKYGDSLLELKQKLSEAEGEFAAIVRKR